MMRTRRILTQGSLFLVAALSVSACVVPKDRYDALAQKAEAEQAAHRSTASKLEELRGRVELLQSKLDAQSRMLAAQENDLSQSQLDIDTTTTERNYASALVDQLRGELARAGDHLRHFSEQKSELQTALDSAAERAKEVESAEETFTARAKAVRDVTLALHESVAAGDITVDVEGGQLVVSLSSAAAYVPGKHDLKSDAAAKIRRVGATLASIPRTRVEVTELSPSAELPPEDLIVRLQKVSDALAKGGLAPDRVTVSLPPESSSPGGEPALRLSIDAL